MRKSGSDALASAETAVEAATATAAKARSKDRREVMTRVWVRLL
jgi:hypothetical protein